MKRKSKRYRLMIIPNTLASFGGGEHLALEMANKLRNVCDVTILNPVSRKDIVRREKSDLLKEYRIADKQVVDIPCMSFGLRVFETEDFLFMIPTINGTKKISDMMKNTDSVYCITHNPLLLTYSVTFANRYGKKFVFAIQNRIFASIFSKKQDLLTKGGSLIYRNVLRRVRYFHSLNSFDTHIVKKHIQNARVYQIPGFTTFENQKVGVNGKKFGVLFVGRLPKYQKGVDLFCEIVEKVVRKEPKIEFRVCGAGGDGEPLVKALARRYPSSVKWLGFMPYEKVKEQYKDASLLAFTARGQELRYFPLVFLESQSFGLPVVTFEGEGYEGIVTDGVEGSLINEFDTEKFANAIMAYYRIWLSSKSRYLQLKRKISALTRKKFSDKVIIPKMGDALSP
jgi:glycosyltransferase involved in cell wall biosynthesis